MAQNVLFKIGTRAQFDLIVTKDKNTLYWLSDTQELYKGDILFGTGALASENVAGLLSAEDYKKLQELISTGSEVEDRLDKVEQEVSALKESASGGIHYKGSVPTYDDLPKNANQGDLYEVSSDGSEWCFNGNEWFEYGTSHFVPVAGDGIIIDGSEIGIKIAEESHGLTIDGNGIAINLATAEQDGAMSKEDKVKLDAIPETYSTIDRVKDTSTQVKYDISAIPEGTLVNYGENEIRIMCPADAKFVKQQVGNGGNANMYYMTFTTYAPDGAVTFKEGDRGVIIDEVLDFENTAGTGVDKYGRKYKHHWFALAMYDETSDSWTYFGKNSSVNKYIGWDYVVEWYDANGVKFASDAIRINLSNENCHNNIIPYYMNNYVTAEAFAELQASFTWTEF